ncbi:MAG TPA: hypothetical protein VD836_19855 [Solirubrobacteraceae bacterium]|nr:hypothetical protein [Solirubrobacteraceae bacterium]
MAPRTLSGPLLALALALAPALAGCGSAPTSENPPPAGPPASPPLAAEPDGRLAPAAALPDLPRAGTETTAERGATRVILRPRERRLELHSGGERIAAAPAGVGPTRVVSDDGNYVFVADTAGGAVLVFRVRPELALVRRYALPDGPYGMAIDNRRHRMFVTQVGRNRLWVLNVGARLTRLGLHPTPRQPDAVAVDERTGRVYISGRADGVLQILDRTA